jgi:hypothetical protein
MRYNEVSDLGPVFYLDFFFREDKKLFRKGKFVVSDAKTANFERSNSMFRGAVPSHWIKHCSGHRLITSLPNFMFPDVTNDGSQYE